MSFTTEVIEELLPLPIKKTCCRRAMLLGLFCAARQELPEQMSVYLYHGGVACMAKEELEKIFRATATVTELIRAGRKTFLLQTDSIGIRDFLKRVDEGDRALPHAVIGFRCGGCEQAFLRGVFFSCATVTDPKKGYHLELSFPTEGRAELAAVCLEKTVGKAGRSHRQDRTGVYYKSNGAIFEFLYCIGCSGKSFAVTDVSIEREIRNDENRATNCVAKNIAKSVDAAKKQRQAIEYLIRHHHIEALPEELRYTAELRMEYDSATLSELARLHEPPISKSGLNRRLNKLMETAEEKEREALLKI